MFYRTILFVFCLLPFFAMSSEMNQEKQCSTGAAPSWVKLYDFPVEPVSVKPSQVNYQQLLIDTQRNWDEKTTYRHYATKILTQSGVQTLSQLSFDFDPSYCQVIVHAIRIFREGEWLDRLKSSRHQVIQRETELEQNIYNGDLTLVYFLDDIREGDIIDYSYSQVGHFPLFASHYAEMVYFQRESSVEKITHRFLGHPDLSFAIKTVNTSLKPIITELSPSLREWLWVANDTPATNHEPYEPVWHNPPIHIQMSQYQTWRDVAQKLLPLFTLPSNFAQSISPEMRALIETWKSSTKNMQERALLATRFVQDKVRYLGIEEGMGAFQPNDPNLTFQRRFGDCKDKTFLLHALLQLMDISSTPLLVHSERGRRLPEILPMPGVFDHIVLKVEMDGRNHWVDSTISLQGGSLQTNYFPDYEWGLLLSDKTVALTSLPKSIFRYPTEIDTSFVLESEDSARLKIKSVFYDSRADSLRRSLEWYGLEKTSEHSLSDLQEFYGSVTLSSPMEVFDDRNNNKITLIESYCVPSQILAKQKTLALFSFVHRNYLDFKLNPERSSPYSMYYPLWVKESIHIENSFLNWKLFENQYTQKHESFVYTLSTKIKRNSADYLFELKHLQDHVPVSSLRGYWEAVNEISRKAPSNVIIAHLPGLLSKDEKQIHRPLYTWIALALLPLIYFVYRKKRETQDLLSFYLSKSRKFFLVLLVWYLVAEGGNPIIAVFSVLILSRVFLFLYSFVEEGRSVILSLLLQCFFGMQVLYLTKFVYLQEGVSFYEKVLELVVCWLYLGSSILVVNKVIALLSKEKKEARVTVNS